MTGVVLRAHICTLIIMAEMNFIVPALLVLGIWFQQGSGVHSGLKIRDLGLKLIDGCFCFLPELQTCSFATADSPQSCRLYFDCKEPIPRTLVNLQLQK